MLGVRVQIVIAVFLRFGFQNMPDYHGTRVLRAVVAKQQPDKTRTSW